MSDIADVVSEAVEHGAESRLNSVIALMVAVTATFTALCNVKDGNIVQAMAQDQANAVDAWAYYQAKGTKQNLAEAMLDQLSLDRDMKPELTQDARARLDAKIAEYAKNVKKYELEKIEIKNKAENFQRDYDSLNVHDDQFDLAEALMSVSIALFGVTALTRKRALLGVALTFAGFGILFGLAGFFRWGLHPDVLTQLFS
jgi:Domain of unknown function (DUF4337)